MIQENMLKQKELATPEQLIEHVAKLKEFAEYHVITAADYFKEAYAYEDLAKERAKDK